MRVPALWPATNTLPIREAACALLCCLAVLLQASPRGAPAQEAGNGGSIQGTVQITAKLTAQRMRFRLYPGVRSAPPPRDSDRRGDEYPNVVIFLTSATPITPLENDDDRVFRMAQEGETFVPHVLPIPVGSTVDFPNLDPIFHNVFSLSGAKTFDLGRYPQGDSRSVKFDRVGIVPVFCHIHSDMSANILVLDNPYFTVPGADHRYRIDNIPPGAYTLVAWHERAEPVKKQVQVEEGQTLEINLTVPIENEAPSQP